MSLSRLRPPAVALGVLLLTALLAGVARADLPRPLPYGQPVTGVAVTGCSADAATVPSDYLGLSVEWSMVQHWFGTSRTDVVQPTIALLQSLEATPGAGGVLRIGGNSQDGYVWNPKADLGTNTLFAGSITPGMIDALLEVSRMSGWRLVLGLNLRDDRPDQAAALTHYAVTHDPTQQLLAVELGNEPTTYFGSDSDGYIARLHTYVDALQNDPVTRSVRITGPALSNRTDLRFLTAMQQSFGSLMPFLTWHHYANRPSITTLLSSAVSAEWTDRLAQVRLAAQGTPTRMDEGNSVGNGGLDRVSNVMGSTAWLTDAMLTGAESGLAGFNVHSWDGFYYATERRTSYYTPFVVRDGLVYPRPEFYALALLKNVTGKQFCSTTTADSPTAPVKAWSLRDATTGHLLVYVVEKRPAHAPALVHVFAPSGYTGGAAVSRIEDPGGCGGRSTTIDSATLPTGGGFTWSPASLAAAPGTSTYSLRLGACQTALLDISPG